METHGMSEPEPTPDPSLLEGRILDALAAGPLAPAALALAVGMTHHELQRALAPMLEREQVDLNRSGYFLVEP
jgi:hypothetical protein